MSRTLRTFSLPARPLLRPTIPPFRRTRMQSSLAENGESSAPQSVRFVNPGVKSRRTARLAFKFIVNVALFYYVTRHLFRADEGVATAGKPGAAEEVGEEGEEGEEEEVEVPDKMPDDAVFIPLWFPKEKPQYLYKGSDPEWKSSVAFSRDRERTKKVKQDVVNTVVQQIDSVKNLQRSLGAPLKSRRVWLDFEFPHKAPKEYERYGIEIADEYVAITSRPMSESQYARVTNTLWPTSIATSFWVSYQTFWSLQYARFKELLNIKSNMGGQGTLPQPRPFPLGQLPRPDRPPDSSIDTSLDKMADPTSPETGSSNVDAPKPPAKPTIHNKADTPRFGDSRILSSVPQMPRLSGDAAAAVTAFKRTLAQTWRPPITVERGQIALTGLIEIEGSKGVMLLDVMALYHPGRSQLDSVSLGIRRATMKKQSPPGGA